VREGRLQNHPRALILDGVQRVLEDYASASGYRMEE